MEKATFALLQRRLAAIHFDGWDAVEEAEVYGGAPHCYALFLRTILAAFPGATATLMRKHSWLCIEDDDRALGRVILRLLSAEYGYKCPITPAQFGISKFASAKMKACLELFDLLQRRSVPAGSCSDRKGTQVAMSSSSPTKKSTGEALRERLKVLDERRRLLNHLQRD